MDALAVGVAAAVAGNAFFLCNGALGLSLFCAPRRSTPHPEATVSVLIPARNEAARIGPCLDSLRHIPEATEILVLDDFSEDGTAEVVAEFAQRDSRIRCLRGNPLPEGWTGKCWAAHQLSLAARGDYLLFTDADTEHFPGGLGQAMSYMVSENADMLSAWPLQRMATWSERWIIPWMHMLILAVRPHWMERWMRFPVLGAANGQFVLFRASSYRQVGGHTAVAGSVVEDIGLARLMLGAGLKSLNVDGTQIVGCHMYAGWGELVQGFTKNLRPAVGGGDVAFCLFHLLLFVCLSLPWFLVPILAVIGRGLELCLVVSAVCGTLVLRGCMAWRFRGTWDSVVAHPIAHLFLMGIAARSMVRAAGAGVEWKGRVYARPKA